MRPVEVEPRFLRYVVLCRAFVDTMDASTFGSRMPRADWDFIGNMLVPVPEEGMQRAIADYLDRETARLDALIAAKERVLELLTEKRRALITCVVARGLDPRVPLRDTGIPWLGEVPTHWEVWKLGHCASVGNGSTPSRSNTAFWTEGNIPWLNSSVVNRYEATRADQFVTDVALRECHLPLVRSGSVLVAITGQGKTRGQAVVLSFDATINQHLAYVSPDHSRLAPWFLRWTFFSAYGFLRSISDLASCITSRRNLHPPCISRHRFVLRIRSPSRFAQRRERRLSGVCVIFTRCEEDAHGPIDPKSLVFMGRASPSQEIYATFG